jgi:hypothetical protein
MDYWFKMISDGFLCGLLPQFQLKSTKLARVMDENYNKKKGLQVSTPLLKVPKISHESRPVPVAIYPIFTEVHV